MQNIITSHPYVDSVSMNGNQINLKVEVTDFETTKGGIEISGQATQVSGALALFSQVVDFTKDAVEDPDGWFVTVTANVIPPIRFKKDQDITVFVRVARVWVTVLGEQSTAALAGTDADPDTTWDRLRESSQLTNQSWPAGQ
jgi:hypothetical protein